MKVFFFLFTLLSALTLSAQSTYEVIVLDEEENPLFGASILLVGSRNGAFTNDSGYAKLNDIPKGAFVIKISSIGYEAQTIEYQNSTDGKQIIILVSSYQDIDEIKVEATRSNRSIADLPTRTEVLTDEIDEAASMEPSKIAHLITHSTGIQVQTTSASSNGAVVRIQGLNGRYTQMLKDGFPLYGGFSGSLDILQIPPLDLRQVEYVKGSASTLYGGGAIGGLINLITKKPNKEETLLHMNVSHIGAKDFNAFASRRFKKFGFTNLASFHMHSPFDADGDGYSDVPEITKLNFNPKLFFYPDEKSTLYLGATISNESRMGGDISLIDNNVPDSSHFYYDKQKSKRYTYQFSADRSFTKSSTFTIKNSMSLFDRFIQIRRNVLGETSNFSGEQLNSFTELNYNLKKTRHNLNLGLNVYTDKFTEQELDTSLLRNQQYITAGAYVNYLWDIHEKFSLESGLRTDYVVAKADESNNAESFILPRLSALFKASKAISLRLGGGLGYRMPTIFNEEAEPFGYRNIDPINFDELAAERSYGANFDFKFQSKFGTENILLTFNQMFFYNLIDNPILLTGDQNSMSYSNSVGQLYSQGFESQLKLTFWQFTWFVGYTYTDAFIEINGAPQVLTLTPQHSIKGDLLFVSDNKWRIGWDYEYKSQQTLSSGIRSRELFTTGIIVERTIDNFVIFLNAENFTDTRQTKFESLLTTTEGTPQFTDVWAPLDGFFFNVGLKIKL